MTGHRLRRGLLNNLAKGGKMLNGGKGRFASSDPLPYVDIEKGKEKSEKKKKRLKPQ